MFTNVRKCVVMSFAWLDNFGNFFPTTIIYIIIDYVGSPIPYPSDKKIQTMVRHLQKRYCKVCGEYMSVYGHHRHYPRQKFFKYTPKYEQYLKVYEMLYISKTNYRMTKNTPYDMIVVWQNTRAYYCSFRKCLNTDKCCKIQSFRDVYFTDIGISSSSCFWFVDEWNRLYPTMSLKNNNRYDKFEFTEKNVLWTPDLNPI